MIVNLQLGSQRKLKCLKEQQKSVILVKTMLMLLVVQNCFFSTIQPVRLDIIKPWPVTCPGTEESSHKLEFEVNNDINSKVSLCKGDITKLNVDVIVNSVNETLIGGGHFNGAIHEAAWPRSINECQKSNGCETGEQGHFRLQIGSQICVSYFKS